MSKLKESKAIISPGNSRELYANPRFALKGGLFDREEIEMLIYHDKHIKKLINKSINLCTFDDFFLLLRQFEMLHITPYIRSRDICNDTKLQFSM